MNPESLQISIGPPEPQRASVVGLARRVLQVNRGATLDGGTFEGFALDDGGLQHGGTFEGFALDDWGLQHGGSFKASALDDRGLLHGGSCGGPNPASWERELAELGCGWLRDYGRAVGGMR